MAPRNRIKEKACCVQHAFEDQEKYYCDINEWAYHFNSGQYVCYCPSTRVVYLTDEEMTYIEPRDASVAENWAFWLNSVPYPYERPQAQVEAPLWETFTEMKRQLAAMEQQMHQNMQGRHPADVHNRNVPPPPPPLRQPQSADPPGFQVEVDAATQHQMSLAAMQQQVSMQGSHPADVHNRNVLPPPLWQPQRAEPSGSHVDIDAATQHQMRMVAMQQQVDNYPAFDHNLNVPPPPLRQPQRAEPSGSHVDIDPAMQQQMNMQSNYKFSKAMAIDSVRTKTGTSMSDEDINKVLHSDSVQLNVDCAAMVISAMDQFHKASTTPEPPVDKRPADKRPADKQQPMGKQPIGKQPTGKQPTGKQPTTQQQPATKKLPAGRGQNTRPPLDQNIPSGGKGRGASFTDGRPNYAQVAVAPTVLPLVPVPGSSGASAANNASRYSATQKAVKIQASWRYRVSNGKVQKEDLPRFYPSPDLISTLEVRSKQGDKTLRKDFESGVSNDGKKFLRGHAAKQPSLGLHPGHRIPNKVTVLAFDTALMDLWHSSDPSLQDYIRDAPVEDALRQAYAWMEERVNLQVCARCRAFKLPCDHQIPCQHCKAVNGRCFYQECDRNEHCKRATCEKVHSDFLESVMAWLETQDWKASETIKLFIEQHRWSMFPELIPRVDGIPKLHWQTHLHLPPTGSGLPWSPNNENGFDAEEYPDGPPWLHIFCSDARFAEMIADVLQDVENQIFLAKETARQQERQKQLDKINEIKNAQTDVMIRKLKNTGYADGIEEEEENEKEENEGGDAEDQ